MAVLAGPALMPMLQGSVSRRIGPKQYLKYFIVIPPEIVASRSWSKGQIISLRPLGKDKIILQPAPAETRVKSMKFEEFVDRVEKAFAGSDSGLTWTQIRHLADLRQKNPPAIWVKRMQEERGLKRTFDAKSSRMIWKTVSKETLAGWLGTGNG